ncbi:hypothetical protein C8F04DRAFT_1229916 [Mycena alexandri]|uniref:Uncharacterized protein n=1 Tax=Mycena alexandri TaxID=1745969 RepID=A0AAD6TBW3_9AGAR|nr:hypothetical protein C8F04DRAFT_1229916 [Mycena alexandri]
MSRTNIERADGRDYGTFATSPPLLSAGVGAASVALTTPRVGHWRLEALYTGGDRWAGQAIEMGTTGVNYAGLMRGGSSREGFEGLASQGDTALEGQRWRDDLTPFSSAKRSHRLTEGHGACDLKGYLHFPGLDVRGSRWCTEWRVMQHLTHYFSTPISLGILKPTHGTVYPLICVNIFKELFCHFCELWSCCGASTAYNSNWTFATTMVERVNCAMIEMLHTEMQPSENIQLIYAGQMVAKLIDFKGTRSGEGAKYIEYEEYEEYELKHLKNQLNQL